MLGMIDSHCHLADAKFDDDIVDVIARAKVAGVDRMIAIADSIPEGVKCLALSAKFDAVYCTIGVHPHCAKDWSLDTKSAEPISTRDDILKLVHSSKKVKGIGEIGLDYHYDLSPREIQRSVFRQQLELAKELKLPAVVHCRESVDEIWSIVNEIKPEKLVLHCCTERWTDVERFVTRGYLLSFTGIATYPKSDVIRDTIKHCPLQQMMIETDAPYLAPVPHRGKRNEPAFVVEVAKIIAQIKGISIDEVDAQTTRNAVEFFNLPQ